MAQIQGLMAQIQGLMAQIQGRMAQIQGRMAQIQGLMPPLPLYRPRSRILWPRATKGCLQNRLSRSRELRLRKVPQKGTDRVTPSERCLRRELTV